ncbi:MAG: hypothetical protein AB7W16_02990 [Candidatus Obscuribacterales bacterium]
MRAPLVILVALACLGPGSAALADAAYLSKEGMIDNAGVIALVAIDRVEKTETKGAHFIYRKKAIMTPLRVLKGDLRKGAVLYADESFLCARTAVEPGKALVFLRRDGSYLVSNNWELGVRQVEDDKLEWPEGGTNPALSRQNLDKVIAEIMKELKLSAIRKARYFCDGAMGEGGERPPEYLAFVSFASGKTSISLADLEKLLGGSGTTAEGKLYAALLARKLYRKDSEKDLRKLAGNKTSLNMRSGCEAFETTLGEAISELLEHGKLKYLDFGPVL